MARAIPDQPSRTQFDLDSKRDECSTGKVAYGEDHSDPTEYIPGSSKTAGAIPLKPDIP